MLRQRNQIPLDYSLCCMTVTVYHREGLTREVVRNAHLELTHKTTVNGGISEDKPGFLLVVPGELSIAPGDKVVAGVGPAITDFHSIDGFVAESVKPRYFMGKLCHTEVRG